MTARISNSIFWDVIEQPVLQNVGWEVMIYDRDNPTTLLAVLPRWKTLSFSKVLSDTGSAAIEMDMDDSAVFNLGNIQANLVKDENIIKLVRNGVPRFAFLNEDSDEEHVTSQEDRPFSPQGRGVAKMLEWATVLPPNYPVFTSLNWTWAEQHGMKIWRDLKLEADTRGSAASNISLSFTDTNASDGKPWLDINSVTLDPGGDLLTLLRRFAEAADAEWIVRPTDLVLDCRQTIGHERSDYVRFFISHNQLTSKIQRTRRNIANVVYAVSANNKVPYVADAGSIAKWGRRETLVQTSNAKDSQTAQSFARIILAKSKIEVISASVKVQPDVPGAQVFLDYDLGDWVWIDSMIDGFEGSYRVMAISMKVNDLGEEDVELTLSSATELWQVALQKLFERKTGAVTRVTSELQTGTTGSGGSGGPQGTREFSTSNVDLGSHDPSTTYHWYTVSGVPGRAMVWRFKITSGGSVNWAIQVRGKDNGGGELMFEAVGIGDTEYQCSWPWIFENQDDPQQNKMYLGVKNLSGATSIFTLVDMRGEELSNIQ